MTRTTPFQLGAASLLTLVCVLFGGCGIYQSKKDAEAVLAHHFQTIATNGYVTALGDYGPQFFQQTTRDEWMKALTEIESKLGTYQSHTTGGWRVFKNPAWKPGGAGTKVSIQCQVTYSKHTATESFTLFKGETDSNYKIVGHHINSTALLIE